ncbi:MAG TPA: hypothetical protein DEP23_00975, partial [Ruminococcaceae bacterium]|nr:hypothetical protein [Oscillospiraceae bacterium]
NLPDGDYKEIGKGKLSISTPSGTSENGNIPILYANKNDIDSIGISVRSFDGSKLSYVYVDKKLNTKDQYADTDTSIYLSGNALSVGTHKVEVVQYDTNKPGGKITTYKSASYEIKAK